MRQPDETEIRSRAYYDGIAAGYDAMLDRPGNRAMRECFWQHVERAVPPRSHLLDFGAGSGLDTEHFVQAGHRVTAYDLSDGMIGVLRHRCAAQIAAGTVAPMAGTLEQVRSALAARAPFDAIVANFAVFSTISRLAPVFRLFGELVAPGGTVLISMQNPWYGPDMRTREFWRALLGAPFTGVMRYRSAELKHSFRYTPGQVRRAARPEFEPDPRPGPACGKARFGPASPFRLVALRRA
jgi:SAM-dependent methyltransferase